MRQHNLDPNNTTEETQVLGLQGQDQGPQGPERPSKYRKLPWEASQRNTQNTGVYRCIFLHDLSLKVIDGFLLPLIENHGFLLFVQ